MAKKLNLEMSAVENREMRLGTITGWDGKASSLVEESGYVERAIKFQEKNEGKASGCGSACGTKKICKLCELNSPLNQQTMCANAIVECQIGNITDCTLIQHAPIGCSGDNPWFNLAFNMGLGRRGKPAQNLRIYSTNLLESDMVFGASDKLRKTCREVFQREHPKAIFISMACATAIIGEDIDSIADEMEAELGIPVVPLQL